MSPSRSELRWWSFSLIFLVAKSLFCPLSFVQMAGTWPPTTMIFFFLFSSSICNFSPSECLNVEVQALLEFKKQLHDPLNYLDSWKNSISPCHFYGITCDPISGQVTDISLDNKSLSGEISPSVAKLKSLASLVLPSNFISGTIPPHLTSCTNLRVLNLTGNSITGPIPDISTLRNLQVLDLSINGFSGPFPAWVGNLTSLVSLGLGQNDYDQGEIPESLGNLKNLTWLYLAGSQLTGVIPESLFKLEALETLDISDNQISGNLPKSISKLRKLYKIELYSNDLTGEFPAELAELPLREIDISRNRMYGKLPEELSVLKNLVVFQLYENNFSGELPAGFGDLHHLIAFSIYRNNMSGPFPANFGRFSPLDSIDISENHFSGDFPKYLCRRGKLRNLLALENNFSGAFPESYAECKSLGRLRVSKNSLSGNIPPGVWALPSVTMIDFSDNDFSGGISSEIKISTSLNQLLLQDNKFSGKIPSELGNLTNLEKLYLNNNGFNGDIPSEFGALEQLSSLHLEHNSFTGSIPPELGQCAKLVDLNLAWNSLGGDIPSTISLMSSLNSLNLSNNKLTHRIPENLKKLKLSSIDLSNNQLSGRIPSDILSMGGAQAFVGNEQLCISQDSILQIGKGVLICDEQRDRHEQAVRNKLVIFCTIITVLIVLLGGLLFLSNRNLKLREAYRENDLEWEKEFDPKWKLQASHHLNFDVDDMCELDERDLIGRGATGKVYRLDLKKTGMVAVKQLWKGNEVKLLEAEMEILGKIRHRNILKLYAYLKKGGSSFLVFEYMPRGNLFQALHWQNKDGKPYLDWPRRYGVALGAAKGIAYLHHDCSPPIIHRDIKSTNILLDEDYEPKIADFGIAKTAAEGSPKVSVSSFFAGTHGYMAPEMGYTHKVTEKSDVYSFGVVLLELVSGRRPIEEKYGEGKDIVCWVLTHLGGREEVWGVLDPKLATASLQEDMVKVLKVAILCTAKLPSMRPTMKEVVKMLTDASPRALKFPLNASEKEVKPLL